MRLTRRGFVQTAAAMPLAGHCIQVRETPRGELEVTAVDLTGRRHDKLDVTVYPAREMNSKPVSRSAVSLLSYGDYRLKLSAQGFGTTWRDVRVYQPKVPVRVELELGSIGCPEPPRSIGGTIKRDGTGADLWVKAVPMRGTGGGEAPVSKTGKFLIGGLEPSDYVLLVVDGEKVLHHETVRTYPLTADTSKLAIDLSGRQ